MADKFTAIDSKGSKYEIEDNLANRRAVVEQGYKVDDSILRSIGEAARGAEAALGAHWYTNYNPLMLVPRGIAAAVGAATGAPSSDDLKKQAAELDKGTFAVVDSKGSVFHVPESEANRKAVLEQGYRIPQGAELQALTNPEFQGARGAGRAYLENVGNEYLLGIPGMADKENAETLAALQKAQPVASRVGQAAGIVAGLATPGLGELGLAERAGATAAGGLARFGVQEGSLIGRTVAGGVREATRGALISAPRAVATGVLQDPAAGGEIFGTSVVAGALLGSGAPLAGAAWSKGTGLGQRGLEKWSASAAAKAEEKLAAEAATKAEETLGQKAIGLAKEKIVDKGASWVGGGIGAGVGGALGGPVGAAIGSAAGAGAAKAIKTVVSLARDPAAQVRFAEQAQKMLGQIDSIGSKAGLLAIRSQPAAEGLAAAGAQKYLSDVRTPEGYRQTAERVTRLAASEEERSQRLQAAALNAPDESTGGHAALTTGKALDFLFDTLPKDPNLKTPFAGPSPWTPSDAERNRFARGFEIVIDPLNALQRNMKAGTLSREHIEAMQAVYPKILESVRARVIAESASPDAPELTKAQRQQVEILMGASIEQRSAPAKVQAYQDVYAQRGGAAAAGRLPDAQTPGTGPTPRSSSKVRISSDRLPPAQTPAQAQARRASR